MSNKVYTPSTLNTEIKSIISDTFPYNITIEGEVSGFKPSSSGHYYFNLKDSNSIVSLNMWKSVFEKIPQEVAKKIKDGAKVEIVASIDMYVPYGKLSLNVINLKISGEGDLWKKFEELKNKLDKQGYFDPSRKKSIGSINFSIGVVTSETGAVIQDIINTLNNRFPIAKLILYPAVVQGDAAKDSIVKQLSRAEEDNHDVIIVGRGGGSIEDLWAFNEEVVATQIFNMKTPVVSAIGHETDFTIADFVSDLRASTPTQAVMLVTPDWRDLVKQIQDIKSIILKYFQGRINLVKTNLQVLINRFTNYKDSLISTQKLKLNNYSNLLMTNFEKKMTLAKNEVSILKNRLYDLNPTSIMEKGYSITKLNGKIVKDTTAVNVKDELEISLYSGKIFSIINKIENNGNKK